MCRLCIYRFVFHVCNIVRMYGLCVFVFFAFFCGFFGCFWRQVINKRIAIINFVDQSPSSQKENVAKVVGANSSEGLSSVQSSPGAFRSSHYSAVHSRDSTLTVDADKASIDNVQTETA